VSVTLYNGNGGASYSTRQVSSGTVGAAVPDFRLFTLTYGGTSSIQNGSPDGVAISIEGEIVLFASYEGVFTAIDGPAAGLQSVDIGVSETGATPAGQSVALRGSGSAYDAFTWFPPAPASPGEVNPGQTFVPVASEPTPSVALALAFVGPNPVRSSTRLEIELPAAGLVVLDVFDALGRRLARLLEGDLSAGRHQVTLDAAALAPGVYAVRLQAGARSVVQLLTVAR
jgi:hypothetical protein